MDLHQAALLCSIHAHHSCLTFRCEQMQDLHTFCRCIRLDRRQGSPAQTAPCTMRRSLREQLVLQTVLAWEFACMSSRWSLIWQVSGERLDPPQTLPWYPDRLAWQFSFSRNQLRKLPILEAVHELVCLRPCIIKVSAQVMQACLSLLQLPYRVSDGAMICKHQSN